jgi:VIT1/CCC1 family predicted Fe2+/Mn2+ transporter
MHTKPIRHILMLIDPSDALAEALFGLIMALSFTIGARLVMGDEGLNAQELVLATLGCNVAWGIIDAVLFLLGVRLQRSNRAGFFEKIKNAHDEASALAAIAAELSIGNEPLRLKSGDHDELHRLILALAKRGSPLNAALSKDDLLGAFIVFVIVAATAVPATIPFLIIADDFLALRVSNLLLIALLYATGHGWARFSAAPPFWVGTALTFLGLALVAVALMLGG